MTSPASIGRSELLRLRLAALRIDNPTGVPLTIEEVARQLFAVQGQDFIQGGWALGLRAAGSTLGDFFGALESGTVIRSAPFRGTLHFMPAEELGWVLGVTAERTIQSAAKRLRDLELDAAVLAKARAVTETALANRNALARDEYFAVLRDAGIDPTGQRGYHVIWYLSQTGVVVWGPPRGTQQGLVLLEEWVKHPHDIDGDDALRELALRYFTAHGPATERDFAWWTKLTLTDARKGLALAADQLTALDYDGVEHWASTRELDLAAGKRMSTAVHALPGFDEYLLGYTDRSAALADEHFQKIVPGSNGMFLPMIVSKGAIVGTWRRAERAAGVTVTPDPFSDLDSREEKSFEKSAEAFARFRTTT